MGLSGGIQSHRCNSGRVAQMAALSLPLASRRSFKGICRAVMDNLGLYPEDHHQRFRDSQMMAEDQLFMWAWKLHDTAVRCLQPGHQRERRGNDGSGAVHGRPGNGTLGPLPSVSKLGSHSHPCRGPPGCTDRGSRDPQPARRPQLMQALR